MNYHLPTTVDVDFTANNLNRLYFAFLTGSRPTGGGGGGIVSFRLRRDLLLIISSFYEQNNILFLLRDHSVLLKTLN